jgi:anti-sigma regulatory factor (Ser/Thr protein kinase)
MTEWSGVRLVVGVPRLELSVPARPESLGAVRQALERLGLPSGPLDEARLLVTELVSNSIRHAGLGPDDLVHVVADRSGAVIRFSVSDTGPGIPAGVAGSIRPSPGARAGWGLFLVDRMAARWGTDPGDGTVWFELELPVEGLGG